MNPLLAGLLFLVVTNLGTGIYAYVESKDIAIANAKNDSLTSQLNAAKSANKANGDTIAVLKQTNSENAGRARDAQAAATAIATRVTELTVQLAAQEKATGQLREKLRASDAKLRAWGDVPVPVTYLDVLRDRWQSVAAPADGNGHGDAGPLRPAPG